MPCFIPFAGRTAGPPAVWSRRRQLSQPVPPVRRSVASLLLLLALVAALPALPQAAGEIVVWAYTFKYQRAGESVSLLYPLLSPQGTIEFQKAGNTLVVHDTQAAVNRIMPLLRSFDHPARSLRLDVVVVRASRAPAVSPQVLRSDLPDWLTKRLHDLLKYDIFEVQAQAQLAGLEGQRVEYELGQEYKVGFRFGTLLPDQRLKLANFRIARRVEGRPDSNLLQSTLTIGLDQTISFGLASSEASREALMLVLTLKDDENGHR
jgi:hypothetical protein